MMKKIQDILVSFKLKEKRLDYFQLKESREGISFRPANESDIYQLLAIERSIYGENLPWIYPHFEFELVANPQAFFILAEISYQPVAFLGFRLETRESSVYITNLVVKKEFQRQGLASKLLDELSQQVEAMNICKFRLEVRADNKEAQAFYKARGFLVKEKILAYYEDSTDALLMEMEVRSRYNG
ncbi:ribosomal protein S18-alanine N-acetyltransferase [Streptococcaceae bacterium ESL0729]|nr:ribosomal protein S18-alanine N-acetyltransferase [Streptococcaceae bacterium ESL0729]